MNNEINIPTSFQKAETMPEDPVNSVTYGKQTQSANCFLMMCLINNQSAMPYGNEGAVIDGVHSVLNEEQGLIEVKSGLTNNQKRYIYSIVKAKLKPSGIQYILTMHIDLHDYTINIQSYFDEVGMTGLRDNAIMGKMISEGKVTLPSMEGWFKDPYDENYKKGLLMNLSEQKEYDSMYPLHPLTEARNLVKYIIENN